MLEAFRKASLRRMNSSALRTGAMQLRALGEDVVLVERSIQNGKDVFGRTAKNEVRALAVNRATESRWVEYKGKTIEVPVESFVVLK